MSWPAQDLWRAPVGDWPPSWASAWGSDRFGLWADLVVGAATQRMRWIEPSGPEGFWMGSPQAERAAISNDDARKWANGHEHEPRLVIVQHGFWLADTPCTQAFWMAVRADGSNPSRFQKEADAGDRPVEQVKYGDWEEWAGNLVGRFARTAIILPQLPSEVEWEYAARAGTLTAYWWGDEFEAGKANTNVDSDREWDGSNGATTPVKRYPPNPWGLYDVHGNVWEWCDDVWRERLDGEGGEEPSQRALRGGSWYGGSVYARSAYRFRWHRVYRSQFQGFRLSLRSPAPGPQAPGAR